MRVVCFLASCVAALLPVAAGAESRADIDGVHDVGNVPMYLRCEGASETTLVIDGGAGTSSARYQPLQAALSDTQRVCIYDRAGLGASGASSSPRTSDNMARELRELLDVAEVAGPLILLGHSLGGYNIRAFHAAFPEDVVGLIFVDSAHPDQWERLPPEVAQLIAFGAAQNRKQAEAAASGSLKSSQLEASLPPFVSGERRRRILAALLSPAPYVAAAEEVESAPRSAMIARASGRDLDIPVAVLSAGNSFDMFAGFLAGVAESNEVWSELQTELAALSADSMRNTLAASHNLTDTHVEDVASFVHRAIEFIESSAPDLPKFERKMEKR